jgi:hypothetical protein
MSDDALELLLSGVKDQRHRKEITAAYYAFAAGDPDTFPVRFAVLLRAHASSLKALPVQLQKIISTETHRMSDLVLAQQASVRATRDSQSADGTGESLDGLKKLHLRFERELAAHREFLKKESEKIGLAVAASERIVQKLVAHRIALGLGLSYVAGIFSTLAFQHLLPCFASLGLRL